MAKLVCLLVVLAIIQTSLALKCYKCGVGTGKTCKEEQTEETCGAPAPTFKSVCEKSVNKDGSIIKTCGSVKQDGYSSACKMDGEVNKCLCDSDLCNSATTVTFSSMAFAGVMVSLLLNKVFLQ